MVKLKAFKFTVLMFESRKLEVPSYLITSCFNQDSMIKRGQTFPCIFLSSLVFMAHHALFSYKIAPTLDLKWWPKYSQQH